MLREQFGVDAHDEDVFVIAAVEDADVAAIGKDLEAAPEIIVIELLGRGSLKGIDLAALWVDAGHDVFDNAVLAGGVHGLEDEEQRPFVVGVEAVLELCEDFDTFCEGFLGAGLILVAVFERVAGIDVLETELFAVVHPERFGDLADSLEDFFWFHDSILRMCSPCD